MKINVEKLKELYLKGFNQKELAKELGMSQPGIRKALIRIGLETVNRNTLKAKRAKERKEEKQVLKGCCKNKLSTIIRANIENGKCEKIGLPYRFIPLTNDFLACVDIDIYEKLNKFNYCYAKTGYAFRWKGIKNGRGVEFLHVDAKNLTGKDWEEVDHINGNKLDCRLSNLREATRRENRTNLKGGFKGYCRYRDGWNVRFREGKKTYSIIYTLDEEYAKKLSYIVRKLLGVREEFLNDIKTDVNIDDLQYVIKKFESFGKTIKFENLASILKITGIEGIH